MAVNIKPMPRRYLELAEKYRPAPPPIFDGEPTAAEVALAEELIAALDPESRKWYGR